MSRDFNKEQNYEEAVKEAYKVFTTKGLPAEVQFNLFIRSSFVMNSSTYCMGVIFEFKLLRLDFYFRSMMTLSCQEVTQCLRKLVSSRLPTPLNPLLTFVYCPLFSILLFLIYAF